MEREVYEKPDIENITLKLRNFKTFLNDTLSSVNWSPTEEKVQFIHERIKRDFPRWWRDLFEKE